MFGLIKKMFIGLLTDLIKNTIKVFANVTGCSKLWVWVGYFIYLKFTCVFSYLKSLVQLKK